MWLSNTLFLTQGLLLIHVSVVSCMWAMYNPFSRTTSSISRPSRGNVMTSDEAAQRYGGARLEKGRPDDGINGKIRALKEEKQRSNPVGGANARSPPFRRVYGATVSMGNDLMQKFKAMYSKIPNTSNPRRTESSPSDSQYTSALPTANQPFSLYSPPTKPDRPATQTFSPAAVPSRKFPSRSGSSLTDQRNTQQNPSNGQSTPSFFGSPSTRSQPSLNSGAQITNGTYQRTLVTPSGKKREYTFASDGRRLTGKQTLTWPKLETFTQTSDSGTQLGDSFTGILLPQAFIDVIKEGLAEAKASWTGDTQGNYKRRIFSFNPEPEAANYCDVELVKRAVREAQGDDDDYDDPWTYESIYSNEVLELNKRLHNEYREKHYAQPLEYMAEIHPVADAYANYLAKKVALEGIQHFQHNVKVLQQRKWSENLYTINSEFDGKSPAALVEDAINGWYEEINRYRYFGQKDADVLNPVTGHFTCLVWRSSKRMGLGIAKYRNPQTNMTQYVVVVNYDPAGNMQGDFDVNVIQAGLYDRQEDKLPSLDGDQQNSGGPLGALFGFM